MSLGNLGAAKNLLDGLVSTVNATKSISTGFLPADSNQGMAMAADSIRDIIARADLPSTQNVFVKMVLGDATGGTVVDANPGTVWAVLADNSDTSDHFVQVQDNATALAVLPLLAGTVQNGMLLYNGVACATSIKFTVTTTALGATKTNGTLVNTIWVYSR